MIPPRFQMCVSPWCTLILAPQLFAECCVFHCPVLTGDDVQIAQECEQIDAACAQDATVFAMIRRSTSLTTISFLWFFQSYEASLSWNLKGHRGHTTSGNEHCDMAQETCVLTRLPKIGWRCSQVILDCPGAACALKSSTLQAAKVHELWAVGVPSSSSRSMYSCWLEPIHLIRKPAVWLTTLRSWPNSQLLQPGYRCFGVSSSGFELMQPYWKLPVVVDQQR